ncbi:hypothetical protein [Desulfurobacterium indicum]|uniref:ZU5 domain-containing protein n=1 Tax=Desulfurobacterium indicum TaxID=1914305 RepID=A0A1R1MJ65_9BACT|nr:hypothetical protein [Desulfurobacterium indicum]OMH39855.1 hypothetical protein BLW93_08370 [Desulfurobacterium indicum]
MRYKLLAVAASAAFIFGSCGGGGESVSIPEGSNATVTVSLSPGVTVAKTVTVDLPDPETGDVGVDVVLLPKNQDKNFRKFVEFPMQLFFLLLFLSIP